MQENKEKGIEDLVEDAKGYVEARIEYTRLYLVEKASKVFADLVTSTAVIVCFILAFLFGSVNASLIPIVGFTQLCRWFWLCIFNLYCTGYNRLSY